MDLSAFYLWLKAFHILSIIAWMAAILYLPRLMVYHVAAPIGSPQSETFKVMERRLLRAIGTPAMISSWVFGLALIHVTGAWTSGWLHVKLAAVLGLTAVHMYLARAVRLFAGDANAHGDKFYRVVNEIPTLLMIVAVLMVVLKPF